MICKRSSACNGGPLLGWRHGHEPPALCFDPPLRAARLLGDRAAALPSGFRRRVRRAHGGGLGDHTVRSMPTFENTLVPLEQSGKLLGDVARTFYTVSSADATPDIQQIEETLAPLMSAHQDSIQLDAQLYWRIKT